MLLPVMSSAQVPAPSSAAPAAATPAETAKPPEQAALADKRVQEVVALKFDRSPATVLTARAKLEGSTLAADSVELFRLRMLAGYWKAAVPFMATLPPEGRTRAFEAVLKALDQSLASAPGGGGPDRSPVLVPEDIADLSDMAPGPPTPEQMKLLAALLRRALAADQSIEPLMQRLLQGTTWLGGTNLTKRERACDLMIEMGRARDSLRLLPPLEPGRETASFPLLEKHAKQLLARGRQEQRTEDAMESWRLNQILLTTVECPPPIKDRAWRRIADWGRWAPAEKFEGMLANIAREAPQNVIELLKQVAVQVNEDRANREPTLRRLNLLMQRRVAEAVAPMAAKSEPIRYALNQFAVTWIDEAAFARRVYVPPRQNSGAVYDRYGNQMPSPPEQPQNPNQPKPVPIPDLLDCAPSANWRAAVEPALQPRLLSLDADLSLKAENDGRALPLVEALAAFDAKEGLRLANECLRVWSTTRFKNRAQTQSVAMPYYYNSPSQGIPLTRAMQQRNLEELAGAYQRLAALGLALERPVVVNAFVRAHSQAEVFRQESIELVFGKTSAMDIALLADLLQAMRSRLAIQWRKPSIQQQAKTQRTDAQIDAEVGRGYQLLTSLATKALESHPDDWRVTLVNAATLYDWAEFQYGRKVDLAIYMEMRERAFAEFAKASGFYAAQQATRERKDETATIYQQWLNAQLGASDAGQITRQQDPDPAGLRRIRDAILALPGDAAPRHIDALAKSAGGAADSVPSQLKPTYLKAALAVVGESAEARKIRDAVAYYAGLLQEFELDLRLDGDATVGHNAPFGAFLALRHTADIERESQGGFAKYLRNDAQGNGYYGGGMPPVDHRDLLEKGIREKLGDRFEVISISFHDPKVQSYGYGRPGWRETPLAYLLLKAREPAVDKLPSLQLNMDFNDRQGTVVLPVASPPLLIDAKSATPLARPLANLEVTHTLDERALGEGKLTLEVKATGSGLISKFEDVFDFDAGAFKIEETNDSGPAVQRLSSDDAALAAISERTWLIKLAYQESGGHASSATFHYPRARNQDAKVVYKRYRDADLVEVPQEIALVGLPLGRSWTAPAALLGGALIAAVGLVVVFRRQRSRDLPAVVSPYRAPGVITPFSTLDLLRRMEGDRALDLPDEVRSELSETIARVEAHYFADVKGGGGTPDLAQIVSEWLARAAGQRAAS